eukprot:COSAG01_NODE_1666_length_9571_cov_4.915963_1_plen_198_part_00
MCVGIGVPSGPTSAFPRHQAHRGNGQRYTRAARHVKSPKTFVGQSTLSQWQQPAGSSHAPTHCVQPCSPMLVCASLSLAADIRAISDQTHQKISVPMNLATSGVSQHHSSYCHLSGRGRQAPAAAARARGRQWRTGWPRPFGGPRRGCGLVLVQWYSQKYLYEYNTRLRLVLSVFQNGSQARPSSWLGQLDRLSGPT